jgi:hypothetical protein
LSREQSKSADPEMSEVYFDEVVPLRLPKQPGGPFEPLNLEKGYLGDLGTATYAPYNKEKAKESPMTWLPTEETVLAWQAISIRKPL